MEYTTRKYSNSQVFKQR